MDSLADRRIDAGAAESLWVMAPENEWLGTYFHVGARPSFQERDAVSFSEVSPSKISFTRGRESRRVARSNQSMMMQNVCGKDSPAPTLRKRLIFGAPVCRIPKIDPT